MPLRDVVVYIAQCGKPLVCLSSHNHNNQISKMTQVCPVWVVLWTQFSVLKRYVSPVQSIDATTAEGYEVGSLLVSAMGFAPCLLVEARYMSRDNEGVGELWRGGFGGVVCVRLWGRLGWMERMCGRVIGG